MTIAWPVIRKEATYVIEASHHLDGVSRHPDASDVHGHQWRVTLIWDHWEVNPERGFTRDEVNVDESFGARILQLDGRCLNDLMPVPPTSENLAMWLLADWMVHLTPDEANFELDAVRVSKDGRFVSEARRKHVSRWIKWIEKGGLT